MQYNSEANNQDLISDISFWTGQDTSSFSIKDRTRSVNERNNMVWQMIFESYGGWLFMDDSISDATTGVPYADQTVNSGVPLYVLPSGALTVTGVELKDSGGTWHPLIPLTYEEFLEKGGDSAFVSSGFPIYYILQGDVINLKPSPNFTLASALRVFFDQGMSQFTVTDTVKNPGFASIFHRMLSIGASLDYCASHPGMEEKVIQLQGLWNDGEKRLKAFYSKRFKARFPHTIKAGVDLVEDLGA